MASSNSSKSKSAPNRSTSGSKIQRTKVAAVSFVKPRSKKSTLPCGRPDPKKNSKSLSSSQLLAKFTAQLNEYCSKQKLNRSEAREKLLTAIIGEAHHFTAIDLLERLQVRYPEIGKATMYRNLPVLVESGILQEGPHDSNGQVLYELSGDEHHDHIVCLDCRRIFEFHDDSIEAKQNKIAKGLGFAPRDHRHVIYASCEYLKRS